MKNISKVTKVFVCVFVIGICLMSKTNVCFAQGHDIPITTITMRGDVWVISSTNGIMNYIYNGTPIDVLHTTEEMHKKINTLAMVNRYYLQQNNLPMPQGGLLDLAPYDIIILKANGHNPKEFYPDYVAGKQYASIIQP